LIGELHPRVAAAWDLGVSAFWALDLGAVAGAAPEVTTFAPFGGHPSVREDIAVVVDGAVSAAAVIEVVRGAAGDELIGVELFDVYRGEQIGAGHSSLALHLEFAAFDRTLTAGEVAEQRAAIAAALAEKLGGELRA
jgi:phenylalanyl-tRNA synthetase beta chain